MKRISVFAAALVLTLASNVIAAESAEPAAAGCCACPADPVVTGDVYVGPINKYLFRGNNLSKMDHGDSGFRSSDYAVQGGIDLYYKAFTLSYWGNMHNRNVPGYKNAKVTETDLILDYAVPYTIPGVDNLKFNVGSQYFAVDGIDDANEFYAKATYDTLLKPTVAVYWENLLATRAGLFYTASISHKVPIERNVFALNLGALASYNQYNPNAAWTPTYDGVYSALHNFELTASLDYTPTANITITPNYMFSNALSGKARNFGISEQHAYGIKAMFAF